MLPLTSFAFVPLQQRRACHRCRWIGRQSRILRHCTPSKTVSKCALAQMSTDQPHTRQRHHIWVGTWKTPQHPALPTSSFYDIMMKLLTFVSLLITSIEFPQTTSSFCFTASRNNFHRRVASQCLTQTTFSLSSSWSSSQFLFLTRSRAQRGSLLFVSSNPFLLSSRNEKSSSLSSSSTNDEGKNKSNEGPFYNPLLLFRRAQRKILFIFLYLTTKFMSLSLRAKRFILGQVMVVVVFLAFVVGPQTVGKITQSHHHQRPLKTPIEIPYSSFLNLLREQQMRQQQQSSSTLSSTSFQPPQPNPIVTNVLIGKERITFQIDRDAVMLVPRSNSAAQSTLSISSSSVKNSIISKTSPKTTMKPPTPKSNSCGKSNLAAAFTRHVPASPDLIKLLDQHQVPFAAASTQSATIVTVALRSFLVSFYMLILWRMYRAVSGKGGGGTSTDSVGKLASSTLFGTSNNSPNPVTFDDIEGIDEAKFQVMELVDALKYPDKYAVLGARAPKGLLLEGPPGTGKVSRTRNSGIRMTSLPNWTHLTQLRCLSLRPCWQEQLPLWPEFHFCIVVVVTLLKCL